MSHSSATCPEPSELFTTPFELSEALFEPGLTDLITTSFTTNPAMAMAVRHYLYVSWAVHRTAQDLSFQQRERESMYDMLMEQ
jgi:hypothetical protein